ncbi:MULTISPECIES: aldehyde dehydrogenase family protein [Vibrio]|uniref:aldehyde dehydrogenase family protein n=1 Tax=Vibrio TaxID=662 RepID=UPI000619FBD5|nr:MULTISPECIES: aldehyde dehydrogenase family protein [Vibrio]
MTNSLQETIAWATDWAAKPKYQYIGNQWVTGDAASWVVINPADKSEICSFPMASESLVEKAAQSASDAHDFGEWASTPRAVRSSVLHQIARLIRENVEKLSVLETLANGKLLSESLADDIPTCADIFEYYAGWTDKYYGETSPVDIDYINYTSKEPVGACALIAPWNFPLYQTALKLAPALAMGNTVVLKPSEYTPLTSIFLVELITQSIKLPSGVLNLILTDGKAANALTLSDNIHKVSFTGSTPIGRKIIENSSKSNLKATTLELGGKSPCIFFEDAPDLDSAIDRAFTVMFSHKGEKCSEPTRFLIEESIYDYVVDKLVAKANSVKCGHPFDENSEQGPQCNKAQFDKIMSYIDVGKKEAELVAGGYQDLSNGNEKGYYIRPTIFSKVPPLSRIAQEEIFGPVLCCIPFKTDDEAIKIANSTTYGLAAGVYTGDIKRAHKFAHKIDSGMFYINRYGCYGLSSPFGGFRQSGWGKEMAIHSLASYTKTKSIWVYNGND